MAVLVPCTQLCRAAGRLSLRRHRRRRHVSYLLDEELLLIYKLLVIGPVLEEARQELEELFTVHQQDFLHGDGLVRVGYEDLEHVKALVLDHLAVVTQEIHADLEVLAAVDIGRHDVVIRPVQEELAQEFDRLPFCDVARGLDEDVIVFVEEHVEVDSQIPRYNVLVLG